MEGAFQDVLLELPPALGARLFDGAHSGLSAEEIAGRDEANMQQYCMDVNGIEEEDEEEAEEALGDSDDIDIDTTFADSPNAPTTFVIPENKNTEKKMKTIRIKEWKAFNNGSEEPPPVMIGAEAHNPNAPNVLLIRAFVTFCAGLPGMKYNRLMSAIAFLQHHLSRQCTANMIGVPRGFVRQEAYVNLLVKNLQKTVAIEVGINDEDMLANVLMVDVEKNQMILLMEHGLCPPEGSDLGVYDVLSRLYLNAAMRESHMTGQRTDSLVHQMLGFCFIYHYKGIGPGTNVDFTLTNQGKTNSVGRKDFAGMGCHINPLLDATGYHGLALLWRFCGLKEPFPDCLNTSEIKQRPVYRSSKAYNKTMCKKTLYNMWVASNRFCGVIVPRVCHQGRGQLSRMLDGENIPEPKICRHIGFGVTDKAQMSENSRKSYVTTKPAETIVVAAGGSWKRMEEHVPAWGPNGAKSYEVSLQALIELAIPGLASGDQRWLEVRNETAQTNKAYLAKGLKNALGFLQAMRSRLSRAFLMAAARPLDADGKLEKESDPIYIRYAHCAVFSLAIFNSDAFFDLVTKVRVAQDLQVQAEETLGESRSVDSEVINLLRKVVTQNLELVTKVDRVEAQQLVEAQYRAADSRKRESPQQEEREPQTRAEREPQARPAVVPIVSVCSNGLTANGTARKRAKASHRLDHVGVKFVQSQDNVTAQDFWNEYNYGPSGNGEESLRRKEEETNGKWREDEVGANGKKGSKFKVFWSRHRLIYRFIDVLMYVESKSEAEAIQECQAIFDSNKSRNGKPRMNPVNIILKTRIAEMGY
jgi:hypothetical protein